MPEIMSDGSWVYFDEIRGCVVVVNPQWGDHETDDSSLDFHPIHPEKIDLAPQAGKPGVIEDNTATTRYCC